MKVIRKRTEELQQAIIRNPNLLKDLSQTVAEVIGERIQLPENATYVFVPRVYSRPAFWPEVYAMASIWERIPFGGAGPMDPQIAIRLDKDRIAYQAIKDPTPEPCRPSSGPTPEPSQPSLREDILRNSDLFVPLSMAIAKVLANHNITFNTNETFAFIPVAVIKPVFTGQIAAGTPMPIPPSLPAMMMAEQRMWRLYYAEEFDLELDPGVIIDGIPAPELLVALEQQRIGFG